MYSIIIPCYKSSETIQRVVECTIEEMKNLGKTELEFVLVNDCSPDNRKTWRKLNEIADKYPFVKIIDLAKNVGQHNAVMAGLRHAAGDVIISMDDDMQTNPKELVKMFAAFDEGYDVVYGVKVSRQADPVLKRLSATAFYKLQHRMGVETIYNHADFRFLSRRVLEKLSHYQERNVYLRGIIPLLGFPSTTVDDVIRERTAGTSKYTVRKMFSLALDGITSFSVKPIYGIVYLGGIFVFISILIGIYVLYALISGTAEHGWASLMLSIWFVGGVVLLSIGAVGLYIGKIYKEVKRRPLYNVEEVLYDDQNK